MKKEKIPKCWICKKRKLKFVKEYTDESGYKRHLYKCQSCERISTRIKSSPVRYIVKPKCHYCKKQTLTRMGYYYTKRKPRKHKRYWCINCDRGVILKTLMWRSKWDARVFNEVKKLMNKRDPERSKYDSRKSQYYSSRRIVRHLFKKHRVRISHNAISNWARIRRKKEEKEISLY